MTSAEDLQDFQDELDKLFNDVRKGIEAIKKMKTENERNQVRYFLEPISIGRNKDT